MNSLDTVPLRWRLLVESLTRPYRVTLPMVLLVSLVPLYLFVPALATGPLNAPELGLDRHVPVQPTWALIYGALYLFLILLPVLVVRQQEQIRQTVRAYLAVWIASFLCFAVYPTVAPRPAELIGEGFAVWGLRFLYSADPPYNCFPSLHVAHSLVSALASHRVHRGVGVAAVICALLVGLSTLFTKQHYIADVIAGVLLALLACAVFLRRCSRGNVPVLDRRLAPILALVALGIAGLGVLCFWAIHRLTGQP